MMKKIYVVRHCFASGQAAEGFWCSILFCYRLWTFGKKAFEQGKAALMLEGIPEESTPQLYVKDGLVPSGLIIVKP